MFITITALIELIFTVTYIRLIRQGKKSPTLSTWVIFLAGSGLSLITYCLAGSRDLGSAILNTLDVFTVSAVVVAITLWGKEQKGFRPFEKWYIAGIALVIAYGLVTGDAWHSNLFMQLLMSLGYLPLLHTLITEKRNTEPFLPWILTLAAGVASIYPALAGGKKLAALYSIRASVLVAATLTVMAYYHFRRQTS